jgi:hypothetical protein
MKKIIITVVGSLAAISMISSTVLAATTKAASSSSADDALVGFVAIFSVVFYCACYLLLCLFILAFFILDLMMILDVSKRTNAEVPSKTTYLIFLIIGLFIPVVGLISSLIYYFGVKRHLDSQPVAA